MAVTASAARTPMAEALHLIDEFALLESNWDSYGADPITSTAQAAARTLLLAASEAFGSAPGIRPFHVAPLAAGGIQIEWAGQGQSLEVEVGPEGTLGYLRIDMVGANRQHHEADAVPLSEVLAELRGMLMPG